MQKKTVKVIFNRSGGTAGSGGITNRITIPTKWIKEMGITEFENSVFVITPEPQSPGVFAAINTKYSNL